MPLKKGDEGVAVLNIQKELNQIGHFDVNENGHFDQATENAVRVFQTAQHLTVDGVVGPITFAVVQKLLSAQIACIGFADFIKAVDYVLENEGGFVNIAADRGGATNFGITQHDLAFWRGTGITVDDVKTLTKDEAKEIYRVLYWEPLEIEKIKDQASATCILDSSVLYGLETAAKLAQKTVNLCGLALEIDGDLGVASIAAINSIPEKQFVEAYHNLVVARINAIVESHPQQSVFKKGWLARADKLLTLVNA